MPPVLGPHGASNQRSEAWRTATEPWVPFPAAFAEIGAWLQQQAFPAPAGPVEDCCFFTAGTHNHPSSNIGIQSPVCMLAASPRPLLIAAHPDDETIGAAIRISQTPGIHIVHVTEGSPPHPADALAAGCRTRQEYAAVRRQEAVRALARVGVRPDAITNLGFTDQRVSFELESLTLQILTVLGKFQPQIVLTHSYEGGHPDHDSVAFACHTARKLHKLDDPKSTFDLIEFTGYRAESGGIKPYTFVPFKDQTESCYPLSPAERALKVTMLQEFKTQAKTLVPFMLPEAETFRQAPDYDFHHPPHSGRLFYEYFDWGIDGTTWRDLARDAEYSLEGARERVA